jgi:hypothetical protein
LSCGVVIDDEDGASFPLDSEEISHAFVSHDSEVNLP